MKRFFLNLSKFFLNLIIVLGAIISLANIILQLLPADITQPILDWLNTSIETILPCGIATTITTIVLAIAKYANTALKVSISNSEYKQELQRKRLEQSYNERLELAEQRDLAIVELINKNSELIKKLIEQNKYITDYEQIVALKNISSSIIPDEYKDRFREWLKSIQTKPENALKIESIIETQEENQENITEENVQERELL